MCGQSGSEVLIVWIAVVHKRMNRIDFTARMGALTFRAYRASKVSFCESRVFEKYFFLLRVIVFVRISSHWFVKQPDMGRSTKDNRTTVVDRETLSFSNAHMCAWHNSGAFETAELFKRTVKARIWVRPLTNRWALLNQLASLC